MEAEVTHITKDITGEWRDIGALMDQWIEASLGPRYQCPMCGLKLWTVTTEEAAFVHQSRDCSPEVRTRW